MPKFSTFAKQNFLAGITPEAKNILIDINKSRKRWVRDQQLRDPAIRNPSGHDTTHVMPAIIDRYSGRRSKPVGVSQYQEDSLLPLENVLYNPINLRATVRGTRNYIGTTPVSQASVLELNGRNSKGRTRPLSAIRARERYLNTLVGDLESNPALSDAHKYMQKVKVQAYRRQYKRDPMNPLSILDDTNFSHMQSTFLF